MRQVINARRQLPMFLIDIAVPRNIEPSVNRIDNVFLYDIDDLQQVVDRNLVARNMGVRAQRFALVAEDGKVTHLAVEAPGGFDVSRAEAVLAVL